MDTVRDIEWLSFEDAMNELESIASQLETGDAPLEKSIELFERGNRLKQHCRKILEAAEEKVERITVGEGAAATGAVPFRRIQNPRRSHSDPKVAPNSQHR